MMASPVTMPKYSRADFPSIEGVVVKSISVPFSSVLRVSPVIRVRVRWAFTWDPPASVPQTLNRTCMMSPSDTT